MKTIKWKIFVETLDALRRRAFRTLAEELPVPFSLKEGWGVTGPRRIRRLIETWRDSPELASESNSVYESYTGGDVVDVGSAEGWFAILLAPKARPGDTFVLCEPNPVSLPRLHKNVAFLCAQFPHIRFHVIPVPIGDGSPCSIAFPMGKSGHARFLSDSTTNAAESNRSWRLDDLVLNLRVKPSLVKIDVEGAEFSVLGGASKTLERCVTTVAVEIHPRFLPEGVKPDDIRTTLSKWGLTRSSHSVDDVAEREIWVKEARLRPAGSLCLSTL